MGFIAANSTTSTLVEIFPSKYRIDIQRTARISHAITTFGPHNKANFCDVRGNRWCLERIRISLGYVDPIVVYCTLWKLTSNYNCCNKFIVKFSQINTHKFLIWNNPFHIFRYIYWFFSIFLPFNEPKLQFFFSSLSDIPLLRKYAALAYPGFKDSILGNSCRRDTYYNQREYLVYISHSSAFFFY